MPKNKKVEESSDDSGPEDRTPAKKTKADTASKPSANRDNEEEWYIELDSKKRVSITEFKGKAYVNIREYYDKDGKMLPSKKGVALTAQAWRKLVDNVKEIDEKMKEK